MAKGAGADSSVSNIDVVVLAAYVLNAHVAKVDTEDIAIAADRLAPGRFSWKKYKEQINLEHVRVYLFDARKPEKGGFIEGNMNDGWLLTPEGVKRAAELQKNAPSVNLTKASKVRSPAQRQLEEWVARERARMLDSPLYLRVTREGIAAVTVPEAQRFLKIDEYAKGATLESRLQRWTTTFQMDSDLGPIIAQLAEKIREAKP